MIKMHNKGAWQDVVLIGGVARAFNLNMVPEAVSKKLEPMIAFVECPPFVTKDLSNCLSISTVCTHTI